MTMLVAGLVLGPVIGNTLAVQRQAGVRIGRSLLAALPLALVASGLALALDSVLPPLLRPTPTRAAGMLEWSTLTALGLLMAKSVWRIGIRGWLGVSLGSLGPAGRSDHAHVH